MDLAPPDRLEGAMGVLGGPHAQARGRRMPWRPRVDPTPHVGGDRYHGGGSGPYASYRRSAGDGEARGGPRVAPGGSASEGGVPSGPSASILA